MKRLIVIILLILVVVWIAASCLLRREDNAVPSIAKAPYLVRLVNREVYGVKVEGVVPNLIITGYYELNGKRWIYRRGTLRLNKNVGQVILIRRVN